MRFATIGTNFVAEWFLQAAAECSDLVYAGAYSRKEETAREFADKYQGTSIYTDLEKLAKAEDVDAVYISSPNSLHFEQAALLLSNGKHVLCEKTITSNVQELDKLAELADKNGVVLMEAMRSVYTPGFAAIEEGIRRLGTIRRVSFQYCQYSSRYDKFKNGIIENAFNPAFSNGALMDIGVYCVHPLVKLFGMPEKITADAILLENGIDGAGTILARYPGMQAELLYSKISNGYIPSQIQGEEGSLVIDSISTPGEITFYGKHGEEESTVIPGNGPNMIGEIREWVRLMKGEGDWRENLKASRMELQVMDHVRKELGIRFPADEEERWKNY